MAKELNCNYLKGRIMKNSFHQFIFGRGNLISGLIALTIVLSVALGCTCGKSFDLGNLTKSDNSNRTSDDPFKTGSDGDVPSDSVCQSLVKDTTRLFEQAVDSGDFSDLYDNSSTDFQNSYKLDEVATAFKTFTDNKSRVVPILKKALDMDPEFSPSPSIRTEKGLKILVLNGKFDTKPTNVQFEYEFVSRGGNWKMLKLVIKIK